MSEEQMALAITHQRNLLGAQIRVMLDDLCKRYGLPQLHREDLWGWPDYRIAQ